ncbi:kinase-like protein [Ceratobasidium sp. AG-I]|nr:kinase-like protein [Ceratobasidium sp. AG-I]
MSAITRKSKALVSSTMVSALKSDPSYGCQDVTQGLDISRFTNFPVSGGGFGDVYDGIMADGTRVAAKCIRVFQNSSDKSLKRAAREIYAWSHCKHKNILPLVGFARFRNQIAMVSPWMENGPLPQYLQRCPHINRYQMVNTKVTPDIDTKIEFSQCVQVTSGLEYLHSVKMVHGDLKGCNVMVSNDGTAKLIDFGNTELSGYLLEFTPDDVAPTTRWAAPEMLNESAAYSFEADVYALAMTILELVSGNFPFADIRSDIRVITLVVVEKKCPTRPESCIPVASKCGEALWDLLTRCWSFDPRSRPQAGLIRDEMVKVQELYRHELETRTDVPSREVIEDEPQDTTPRPEPTKRPSLDEIDLNLIDKNMTSIQIIEILSSHRCPDITSSLILENCSEYPVQGGGQGDIYRGEILGGVVVALKCPRVFMSHGTGSSVLKNAAHELYTWSRCDHENIVKLLGVALFRDQLAMVSPWIECGNASDCISLNPTMNRLQLCNQVIEGLAYLHESNIVHGDLRGKNILITTTGVAKLVDFGNSILRGHSLRFSSPMNNPLKSVGWTAPELLTNSGETTEETDIYALGMTILELITGEMPFANLSIPAIVAGVMVHGLQPQRPPCCIPVGNENGDALWSLLRRCWEFYPDGRPTMTQMKSETRANSLWEAMGIARALPHAKALCSLARRPGYMRC